MSIEAINEQLLRAIGVGVALLELESLKFRFHNDTFAEWFGAAEQGRPLSELFPDLDLATLRAALAGAGRYDAEVTFRPRRRTMTVAMAFNRALDGAQPITVLVCQNITRIKELESMIDSYSMMVERNTRELKREKEQVERLLLNMMPRSVYDEYRTFGVVTPRLYDPVSVLSLDFAGFAALMREHDPGVIVSELNDIYTAFDRIGQQFGCERIKTVGDVYITMAGVPDPTEDHASAVANAALRFLRYLGQRNSTHPIRWSSRIGLASGPVIGSVVGVQKYLYDVFGPAVLRVTRIRQHARPMTIVAGAEMLGGLGEGFRHQPAGDADLGGAGREAVFSLEAALRPDAAFG